MHLKGLKMAKASVKQLAEAIYGLITEAKTPDELSKAIAAYLVAEQQTKDTDRILREVERLRFERDGVLEIVASSRRSLNESTKQAISQIFEAKKSKIIEQTDKNLVGGVSIQALDKWLDLSIRGRLNQLKNTNLGKG